MPRIVLLFLSVLFNACDLSQTQWVQQMSLPDNVKGTKLTLCSQDPLTGFYRDGYCKTGKDDVGLHIVCVKLSTDFLEYSLAHGNDLMSPSLDTGFPGLKAGDQWCVCISRWIESYHAGVAPFIDLGSSHEDVLRYIPKVTLDTFAQSKK